VSAPFSLTTRAGRAQFLCQAHVLIGALRKLLSKLAIVVPQRLEPPHQLRQTLFEAVEFRLHRATLLEKAWRVNA
jgi:hypothetical protein